MTEIAGWLKERVWYRRPRWRDIHDYARQLNDESLMSRQRPASPSLATTPIPSRLSLERVLDNKTCSPMSLHDFYMYLKYIEHSSENLEFYLWHKNYTLNHPETLRKRTLEDVDEDVRPLPKSHTASSDSDVTSVTEIIRNKESSYSLGEDIAKLEPPCAGRAPKSPTPTTWSSLLSRWSLYRRSTVCADGACRLDDLADNMPDVERQGQGDVVPLPLFARFTTGPKENRAELDAAIEMFLVPGAEKELNISHTLRQRVLQALQGSSDPRHLQPVADHIYEVMKNCSHRNFVSVGLSTGTYETICVGNVIGALDIIGGLLLVFLQGFYPYIGSHSRVNVFYALPLWAMGVMLLLVGTQGMCFVMLTMSKRQALPWERFEDTASVVTAGTAVIPAGPKGWWKRYRNFMSKTVAHDRNFKVEEKHLRRLQRMILFQCAGGGVLAGLLGVVLFCFLPMWKETV